MASGSGLHRLRLSLFNPNSLCLPISCAPYLSRKHGATKAAAISAHARAAVNHVKELVDRFGIPCDFEDRSVVCFWDPRCHLDCECGDIGRAQARL